MCNIFGLNSYAVFSVVLGSSYSDSALTSSFSYFQVRVQTVKTVFWPIKYHQRARFIENFLFLGPPLKLNFRQNIFRIFASVAQKPRVDIGFVNVDKCYILRFVMI